MNFQSFDFTFLNTINPISSLSGWCPKQLGLEYNNRMDLAKQASGDTHNKLMRDCAHIVERCFLLTGRHPIVHV